MSKGLSGMINDHPIAQRVTDLMGTGKSFAEAYAQARAEVTGGYIERKGSRK